MLPVIVNFVLVVLILYFSLRKVAIQFVQKRSETVGLAVKEAQSLSAESQQVLKQYQQKLDASANEVKQWWDEAKIRLENQKGTAIDRGRKEAMRIASEAKQAESGEVLKRKQKLQREVVHKSIETAKKYLSTQLSSEEKGKLQKDYWEVLKNA
jgi:F0F1-type ATP synthase membrane subunit b/b'